MLVILEKKDQDIAEEAAGRKAAELRAAEEAAGRKAEAARVAELEKRLAEVASKK